MTVSTATAVKLYTGDGVTDEFSFPYLVFQSSHISITVDGTANTAWSATGYGDSGGITITFDSAPADESSIIIKRIVPLTQATDLQNFDGNPSDVQEKQYDLNVMISQQQQEQIDRTVKFPSDSTVASFEVTGTPSTESQFMIVTTTGIALGNPTSITFDTLFSGLASGDLLKYNGSAWVNVTQASLGLLTDVVSDTTPQLGGNLDVNGSKIVSTSNGNIDIEPNGTGDVLLGNFTFDADQSVGAGQDDYVLTYDNSSGKISLEAASGTAGLVLLATATASSSTSVDFASSIDSTYDEYIIAGINVVPASDGVSIRFKTSSNAGSSYDNGASDYDWKYTSNSGTGGVAGDNDVIISGGSNIGNDTGEAANFVMRLYKPSGTKYTQFTWECVHVSSAGAVYTLFGGGARLSAADVDAVRFSMSSGNIASGDFKLYGVKKS